MLKQKLQQKLLQKLSPQQIQLIKLLEVPAMQLEQRIKKELEENPVLEEGRSEEEKFDDDAPDNPEKEQEEFSIDDYINEDDIPAYKLATRNFSKDDKKEDIPFSIGSTFHEFLISQLGLQMLNERERELAEYLIGNIDEDGYLHEDLDTIIDQLAFSKNIESNYEELRNLLDVIQKFDPPGVGARDLQECLIIQIDRKLNVNQQFDDERKHTLSHDYILSIAKKILRSHFDEFTKKHYDKIQKRLDISEEELKDAMSEILKLNPKPGGSHSDPHNKTGHHIIPDFLLDNSEGELQLTLNQKNAPELRVSQTYSEMLQAFSKNKNKTQKDKDAALYVKQKLDSAKWFIDAIKQRQNTLLSTMKEIVNYQKNYFEEGDETMLKPMILKDIAERTNLDISTISRVANSKYVQTHFGIYPLKYFFSESMQKDDGEEVSTREIKKILQDCIDGESKKKPLTDEKLAAILKEKGYQIARRTVAKYREQLDIPVARLRKEL